MKRIIGVNMKKKNNATAATSLPYLASLSRLIEDKRFQAKTLYPSIFVDFVYQQNVISTIS